MRTGQVWPQVSEVQAEAPPAGQLPGEQPEGMEAVAATATVLTLQPSSQEGLFSSPLEAEQVEVPCVTFAVLRSVWEEAWIEPLTWLGDAADTHAGGGGESETAAGNAWQPELVLSMVLLGSLVSYHGDRTSKAGPTTRLSPR